MICTHRLAIGLSLLQDKRSVVLAVELGKILICLVSLSTAGEWRQGGGITLRTLALACVPAAVYLAQNLFMQAAYQKLVRSQSRLSPPFSV